jgi:hypothetical protein
VKNRRLPDPLRPGLAWLALLALCVAGCGYQFAASGTNLPSNAHTIYVEKFANLTRITGVSDQFMRYLKDEIARHDRLKLVDNQRDADLTLSGAVIANEQIPGAFNAVLEPTIYAESLVVRAALTDNRTHKVIWSVNSLADTEQFPVVSQAVVTTTPTFLQQNLRANDLAQMTDIQVARTQELSARDQMMAGLAQHLYDAMSEGF